MGANGLEMSDKGFEKQNDGQLQTMKNIQPIVNEESAEIETLDNASNGVFSVGVLMMIVQFILT